MHIFNAKSQIGDTCSTRPIGASNGIHGDTLGWVALKSDTLPLVHVESCVCPGLQCVIVVQEVSAKISANGGILPL